MLIFRSRRKSRTSPSGAEWSGPRHSPTRQHSVRRIGCNEVEYEGHVCQSRQDFRIPGERNPRNHQRMRAENTRTAQVCFSGVNAASAASSSMLTLHGSRLAHPRSASKGSAAMHQSSVYTATGESTTGIMVGSPWFRPSPPARHSLARVCAPAAILCRSFPHLSCNGALLSCVGWLKVQSPTCSQVRSLEVQSTAYQLAHSDCYRVATRLSTSS